MCHLWKWNIRYPDENIYSRRHVSVTPDLNFHVPHVSNTAKTDMCTDKISDNKSNHCQRASSEVPSKMAPSPQINRASSIGPVLGLSKKRSLRDNGLYEYNYESIDSWSSSSNENENSSSSSAAIWKLENSVKSVDSLITQPKLYECSDRSGKVQYDSITVLPPPPPLPRARSFKHYRARTAHPWVSSPHTVGGRASSAPPISPAHQRRLMGGGRLVINWWNWFTLTKPKEVPQFWTFSLCRTEENNHWFVYAEHILE